LGQYAAIESIQRGAEVTVYDIDDSICRNAAHTITGILGENISINISPSLAHAISENPFIIDATNSSAIIDSDMIDENTYISAPGMPLGLTGAAVEKIGNRLYHDPLQTGVAVMAIEAALLKDHHEYGKVTFYE
jgi:pyrrolysine biosynthesis protein PylD